ncbi:hypothetical protein BX616_003936 [Lobosporangium transversale]|uniref:Uncharacterized protein n=1 Tax=Lobosporangium transversale TaxID=64571 RepID=A0A1Y2GVY2_9FUNG|nr:hypothetical protein BCR41DRAFT_350391 [Lobosporangium transversale]KAF9898507.1 hypothetical protein BX616_003936 [Lobosporangium transversale]ORZ20843.1 hypothetical protein BCR41DRAFT_350391 [Lobosporangium transversale]|eukprot:XP_021882752.1 hypothetical protein BCR41DRAFT_350391 [Lobosporangium transversale]
MNDSMTEPSPAITATSPSMISSSPPPRRSVKRHNPVKIHTLNTSSSLLKATSPPSANLFLLSPPPLTAPPIPSGSPSYHFNSSNNNNSNTNNTVLGRARSSSRSSGGVVFKTRPRADSEAARSTMEAMIQGRLDRITRRLNDFNAQSHELHKQVQELDNVMQDKAERLYLVEDHLLKLQGKPGLFEDEEGTDGSPKSATGSVTRRKRSRRLTNDLDDLKMGVKTLRKKFQAAGNAATTVGWWKNLKQARAEAEAEAEADKATAAVPTTETAETSAVTVTAAAEGDGTNTAGLALKNLFIHPTFSDVDLRKNEKQEVTQAPIGLRSPPLTPKVASVNTSSLFPTPSLSLSYTSQKSQGFEDRHSSNYNLKPRPLSIIPDLEEPIQLDASSASPMAIEATAATATTTITPVDVSLNTEKSAGIADSASTSNSTTAPQSTSTSTSNSSVNTVSESGGDKMDQQTQGPQGQSVKAATNVGSNPVDHVNLASSSINTSTRSTTEEANNNNNNDNNNTWIYFLWSLLVRAEYFFLGTAVLGAMVPDNVFALCVGFLSAIIYGVLILHHRFLAPPGKEAPHPPNPDRISSLNKKKRVSPSTVTVPPNKSPRS